MFQGLQECLFLDSRLKVSWNFAFVVGAAMHFGQNFLDVCIEDLVAIRAAQTTICVKIFFGVAACWADDTDIFAGLLIRGSL